MIENLSLCDSDLNILYTSSAANALLAVAHKVVNPSSLNQNVTQPPFIQSVGVFVTLSMFSEILACRGSKARGLDLARDIAEVTEWAYQDLIKAKYDFLDSRPQSIEITISVITDVFSIQNPQEIWPSHRVGLIMIDRYSGNRSVTLGTVKNRFPNFEEYFQYALKKGRMEKSNLSELQCFGFSTFDFSHSMRRNSI